MSAERRIIEKIRERQTPRVIVASAATVEIPYVYARQGGVVVSNKGRGAITTFTLPPAKVGMRVTAVVQAAKALRLDPDGTETIALPSTGVQSAAGKYISAALLASSVQLICITEGSWDVITFAGTWTAEA